MSWTLDQIWSKVVGKKHSGRFKLPRIVRRTIGDQAELLTQGTLHQLTGNRSERVRPSQLSKGASPGRYLTLVAARMSLRLKRLSPFWALMEMHSMAEPGMMSTSSLV